MSEPTERTPTPPPQRPPDRWSGRKTIIFIVVASLLLWALIAWLIHVLWIAFCESRRAPRRVHQRCFGSGIASASASPSEICRNI